MKFAKYGYRPPMHRVGGPSNDPRGPLHALEGGPQAVADVLGPARFDQLLGSDRGGTVPAGLLHAALTET